MKVKRFNEWFGKDEFACIIIPELIVGRVPAGWGCSRVVYITIGWLFWSWQISWGGCYEKEKEI